MLLSTNFEPSPFFFYDWLKEIYLEYGSTLLS